MRLRDVLFIIGAVIIGICFGIVVVANGTEIRFENCEPNTWIGGVKWEWAGERGIYEGSSYHDVPEIELKTIGSIVVDLEPGDYAITHYRPVMVVEGSEGTAVMIPSAVLDFREIEVTDTPETHYFGCGG